MQIQNGFSEQGAGRGMDRACRHKGGWCHMLQDELRAGRVSELSAQRPQGTHWETPAILCSLFQQLISPITLSDAPSRVQLSLFLLRLLQGDILTVIRRVDENWIEAKLGEKVGVCPLQFTEVSSAEFLPSFSSPAAFFKRNPSGAVKVDNLAVWPSSLINRIADVLICTASAVGRSQDTTFLFCFFKSKVEFKSAIHLKICLGIKIQSSLWSPAVSAAGHWYAIRSQVPVVLLS